jgi:bifunctional oligoribonuclease and PAP phosphatase NrnA
MKSFIKSMSRKRTWKMEMKQAIDFIKKYQSFAVTCHINPDGDAAGSILGLAHVLRDMGKTVYVYNRDSISRNLTFLSGIEELIRDIKLVPQVQAAIVLDSGELGRTGEDFEKFSKSVPVLNIDHHETNTKFGDVNWVMPDKSSVGEMLTEMIIEMGEEIGPEAAMSFYTSIITDTGSFQFSNTGAQTLHAAANLVERGADPEKASTEYYHKKPASHLMLLSKCLQTLEFNVDFTRGDLVLTSQIFREASTDGSASDGIINLIMDVETVKVAITYRQLEQKKWKISMRSNGEVDVASFAGMFGGGGHKRAAGCTVLEDLDSVKKQIREEAEKRIRAIGPGGR